MNQKSSTLSIIQLFPFLALLLVFTLYGCKQQSSDPGLKQELLIYCGITMIQPMLDIAAIFEQQENVKIIITKGGSGNLMKAFLYSKTGDLYLPGSDKYFSTLAKENPGVILETVHVGHNKAAMMVQKGNPLHIRNDLKNLTKPNYAVVIGNPNSGSIGRETKAILERYGIYDEVVANAMLMTTDSKDLSKLIINKEADLVVNWYAVSTWDENSKYIDTLEIDPQYAAKKNLVIGLLSYSKHPELAKKFMALASSDQGRKIFTRYGLYFNN